MSGDIEWNIWLKWVQTFICIYKDRIYLIFYLIRYLKSMVTTVKKTNLHRQQKT